MKNERRRGERPYTWFAPFYDPLLGPFLTRMQETVRRLVRACGCRTVLDLCCGTGRQSALLAGKGIHVTGLDLSPHMLRVAGRKNRGRVVFLRGDAAALPFKANRFDAVVLTFALHEKPLLARDRIIRESLRVVHPRGVLLIGDYRDPAGVRPAQWPAATRLLERAAGRDHYAAYRSFMESGGLEGFLDRHRLCWRRAGTFHFGASGLAVVRPLEIKRGDKKEM